MAIISHHDILGVHAHLGWPAPMAAEGAAGAAESLLRDPATTLATVRLAPQVTTREGESIKCE